MGKKKEVRCKILNIARFSFNEENQAMISSPWKEAQLFAGSLCVNMRHKL